MKIKNNKWVMREQAAGDGGDNGGGGDGATLPDPAAGGAAGAAGEGGDQGGQDGSALDGAGGGEAAWKPESVAEKYHVKKEDGTLDLDKTLEKVETARAALEKKMGSGDMRPKEHSEYKAPALPEILKDVKLDTERFAKKAHEMGLSQKQYEEVMGEYYDLLPQMVGDQQKANSDEVTKELEALWKDSSEGNFKAAYRAANTIAESIGLSYKEVNEALGNNPMAIRILAAVGKEMSEDKTPGSANGSIPPGFDISAALASPAYMDAKHPDHKKVSAQVSAYYAKNTPKE
ncbi:hypothetical protein DBR37_01625 [Herminiimonas sp. KBW02]|nr:hypothetical protein DBR37_01625 [Herminiimonas sp. KBW02]